MPMVETTRDIYRQKAALDIHLAILNLQQTMVSALCLRQVSETMFWPKNAALLFGDIQDGLGEKIVEFERMRKQCDDIQNLASLTILYSRFSSNLRFQFYRYLILSPSKRAEQPSIKGEASAV